MKRYKLAADGKTPELCADHETWTRAFEADRHVARDSVDGVVVSTVFLSLDHNFDGVGPPVLWETMVFGGKLDQVTERYTSYDEAATGHRDVLRRVQAAIGAGWHEGS